MNDQQTEQAARILHNWNRAYCATIGDPPTQPWDQITEHQRESHQDAKRFVLQNPQASPEDIHQEWTNAMIKEGWTLGPVKNEELKTHPNLVPYRELPAAQRSRTPSYAPQWSSSKKRPKRPEAKWTTATEGKRASPRSPKAPLQTPKRGTAPSPPSSRGWLTPPPRASNLKDSHLTVSPAYSEIPLQGRNLVPPVCFIRKL